MLEGISKCGMTHEKNAYTHKIDFILAAPKSDSRKFFQEKAVTLDRADQVRRQGGAPAKG
jgi:hypothetical protein